MKKIFWLAVGFCLAAVSNLEAQQRAFPGAEGYGAYESGGRGGRVVYVTHTGDAESPTDSLYPGSFRAAIRSAGSDPVTIIFKCGGAIKLRPTAGNSLKELKTPRSNITIAGQTGLGDGICIGHHGVQFSGNNIIIRYMRFRPGDAMVQNNPAFAFANGGGLILDHCSFSWSVEENTNIDDIQRVTMQNCINSESLYNAGHSKGARSYAATIGGSVASYHHNLLAHHMSRMPRENTCKSGAMALVRMFDYRNNVHYNWGRRNAFYGGELEVYGGMTQSNLINNYFKAGPMTYKQQPDSTTQHYFCAPSSERTAGNASIFGFGKWWLNGNILTSNPARTANNMSGILYGDYTPLGGTSRPVPAGSFDASAEFPIPTQYQIATTSADTAYKYVLLNAGATLPKRDAIDKRVINEVLTGDATCGGDADGNNPKRYYGIIDSHNSTRPADADASWDAWDSHYCQVALISEPDTFAVKTFIGGEWKTEIIKMSRTVDSDGDGIPDWWEKANGLGHNNPDDGRSSSLSGYSNLEVYLNSFPHANAPADEVISTWRSIEPLPCDTCGVDCDTCDINTGIVLKGEAQPHLRVYPNPVTTDFQIETVLEPKLVELYNLQGQRAASFPATTHNTYSVVLLHKGVYFVRVTFANGKFATQRIVK